MKKFYSISVIILLFNVLLVGQTRIYAPNLRAPQNISENQNPDVVLDWDAVTGQTTNITYEVQISTDSAFSNPVTFPHTNLTAYDMHDLLFGMEYYWRVKAFENDESSDWSEVWTFTVIDQIEFKSIPKSGQFVYSNQEISWDEVTGLIKYQLQLDTSFTWKILPVQTEEKVYGSFILPNGKKWIVGDNGLILNYDGSGWVSYSMAENITFNDVYFVNDTMGYVVGDDGVAYFFDGSGWNSLDIGIDGNYTDVSFADENNGWIVGTSGLIINYNNGTWIKDTAYYFGDDTTIFNKDFNAVYALNNTDVWACGKSNTIAHFDGMVWSAEKVGSKDYNDIWFVDENNGFVVGKSGSIYNYNGSEWVEQVSNISRELFGVAFSGTMGYVVGDKGTLLSYNGESWDISNSGVGYKLYCIYGQDGMQFLCGGETGLVLSYEESGFNSPYAHTYNVNADSVNFQFSDLLFGQAFYYRIRGMHNLDTSAWSIVKSIRTFSKPTLSSPVDGLEDANLDTLYKWNDYGGATEYTFQISPYEDFSDGFILSIDSLSARYIAKYFGKVYYWRVNAANAADLSEWSDIRTLTTINMVSLTSPENGAEKVTTCPNYIWEEINGAPSYELWVDKDANFTQPRKVISDIPSFQCENPLERNTVYYWKVRGATSVDTSAWSDVWSFKIEGYIGIDDVFSSDYVDIYPNPAKDNITLTINSLANGKYRINICDLTGKVVYNNNLDCRIGENDFNIRLTDIQKGLYFINITKENQSVSKKLFIQ